MKQICLVAGKLVANLYIYANQGYLVKQTNKQTSKWRNKTIIKISMFNEEKKKKNNTDSGFFFLLLSAKIMLILMTNASNKSWIDHADLV